MNRLRASYTLQMVNAFLLEGIYDAPGNHGPFTEKLMELMDKEGVNSADMLTTMNDDQAQKILTGIRNIIVRDMAGDMGDHR
jgi:hypothetical protein